MKTNVQHNGQGHEFGKTRMTLADWDALDAKHAGQPYVLVDLMNGRPVSVSLCTYAEAREEFVRLTTSVWFRYRPDSGRQLMVMTQADYLARRDGGEQW